MNVTYKIVLFVATVVAGLSSIGYSQCTNSIAFGSATAPTTNSFQTISTCTYQEEYNTISGIVAGETYVSDADLGGCITVHSGTPAGPVVAFGSAPLTWTATVSGTYYIHYTLDCTTCATATSCVETSIACSSCAAAGPCSSITPLIGCGASIAVSLSGAGIWDTGTCGFSTPGLESIYSITATSTGIHSIDVTSISGGFIDFMWIDASLGCSSTAAWNCISDIASTGNYGSFNWTAGNTYYIMIDPEVTTATNVTFDVNCPTTGPAVAGDCAAALPICTNLSFAVDPNGFGLVDELCTSCIANPSTNPSSSNSGCLLSGELNSTWFTVNVNTGGTLEFSFGAPGGGNCFDWIMWPYNATACAGISGNTLPPVACNWNSPCDSYTGVASTPPAGGSAGNFEPTMTVSAGQQFVICFSNYSSAYTSVPLNFFGTSDISCTTLPVEFGSLSIEHNNGVNHLFWNTLSEVNCDYFEIEKSYDSHEFVKIGEVKGSGTSLEISDYIFTDDRTIPGAVAYYRIKQLDFNGAFTYSETVSVTNDLNEKMKIVRAYPNPTSNHLKVDLVLAEDSDLFFTMTDLSGKIVYEQSSHYTEGAKSFTFPVDKLGNGCYLLKINNRDLECSEIVRFFVEN